MTRFTRRSDSAKLGRATPGLHTSAHGCSRLLPACQHHRTVQFRHVHRGKHDQTHAVEALFAYPVKSSTKSSTSTSRNSHEHQLGTIGLLRANDTHQICSSETPNLLRRYTVGTKLSSDNQLLWRSKPHVTV